MLKGRVTDTRIMAEIRVSKLSEAGEQKSRYPEGRGHQVD
jgi:hypothetical protein